MSQHTATELAPSIIDSDERQILRRACSLPLALTLAFSAKESVYKAFSDRVTLRDSIAQSYLAYRHAHLVTSAASLCRHDG